MIIYRDNTNRMLAKRRYKPRPVPEPASESNPELEPVFTATSVHFGPLLLSLRHRKVFVPEERLPLELKPQEFTLLAEMIRRKGAIISRPEIIRLVRIKGDGHKMADILLCRLRKKVASFVVIQTHRGQGWSLSLRPREGQLGAKGSPVVPLSKG